MTTNKIFDASLKRIIIYGILVVFFSIVFLIGAKINWLDNQATLEATIGLLGAYAIYLVVAYSDYFVKLVAAKYPQIYLPTNRSKKDIISRLIIRLGVSIFVLLFLMLIFAFSPFFIGLSASLLGTNLSQLPIGIVKEIYGALVGGWVFYLFGYFRE